MLIISDRVKESSLTTGSGVVVFDSAFGGFQSFQTGIGDGNTTYYCIENGVRWEVGQGVYTLSGDTLSRDVVFDSSAGGAKINLEGVSTVFCTLPADKAIIQNEASGTYVVDISTLELNSSGIISNTLSNSGDAVFGNDVLVSGDLTVVGSLFGVDDISSSGDIVSSGFLTLIRPNGDAGNFFHAYKEDGTEQTAALHFDGNASPMWKLGLKSNPTSQTAPPTFAYVFAKDGSAGMVSNTNNYASISDGIGFTVYHDTNTVFRASSLTGVYIETTSSANPSLVVTGPPAPITDLQRWSLYDDTILSVIDSGGKIGILNDNPLYELDVNGSGRMDELYLTSGIYFQDGTFQSTAGGGGGGGGGGGEATAVSGWASDTIASGDTAVSGYFQTYVDSQDHSAVSVSGWANTTFDLQGVTDRGSVTTSGITVSGVNLSSGSDSGILYRDGSGDVQTDGPTWDGTTLAVAGAVTIAATPGVGLALQDWSNTAHAPAAEVWTSDSYSGMASFGSSTAHQVGLHVNNGWPGLALKTSPGQVVIAGNAADETAVGMLTVAVNGSTTVGLSIELAAAQSANAFQISSAGTSAGDKVKITPGAVSTQCNMHLGAYSKLFVGSANSTSLAGFEVGGPAGTPSIVSIRTEIGADCSLYFADSTTSEGRYAGVIRYQHSNDTFEFHSGSEGDATPDLILSTAGATHAASLTAATGNEVAHTVSYTTNKLTSGDDTGLLIAMTDTASPGTSLPLDIQVGGTSVARINNSGLIYTDAGLWITEGGSDRGLLTVQDSRVGAPANTLELATLGDYSIALSTGATTTLGVLVDENQDVTIPNGTLGVTASAITDVPVTINLAAGQTGNFLNITSDGGSAGDKVRIYDSNGDTTIKLSNDGFIRGRGMAGSVGNGVVLGAVFPSFFAGTNGVGTAMDKPFGFSDNANLYTSAVTLDVAISRLAAGSMGLGTGAAGAIDGNLTLAGLNASYISATSTMDDATGNEIANTLSYTTNKLTSGDDTGLLISMTDTASPGTSLPLDIQVGGTSVFNVDETGTVQASIVDFTGAGTATLYHIGGNIYSSIPIGHSTRGMIAGGNGFTTVPGGIHLPGSHGVGFSADATWYGTKDTVVDRAAANTVRVWNGTTLGTFQSGLLDVTAPAATDVPLSITGAASQSENMTEWKLNGGTVMATVNSAGEFTNPTASSGTWNEAFGLSALTALTSGQRNVAIGAYSLSQVSTGNYNTAVGTQAATWVDGTGRTAVGYLAGKAGGGNYSTYLGYDCVPQTGVKTSCVFLGASQTTTTEQAYTGTILIGANVAANGDNEFIAGSSAHPINNVYFGKGFDNATPTAYTIHGTGGSGTDIAGADIVIAGGAGTGTGVGGDIVFKTAPAGTTGSSLNSLVTAVTIDADDGNVIFNGANIMSDFSGNPEFQVTNKGSSTTSRVGAVNSSWSEGAYLQSNNASAEGSLYLSGHKAVSRRNVASPVEFNDLKTDVDYIFRGDVSDIVLYMDSGLEYVGVGAAPTAAMLHVTSRAITDVGVTVTGAVGQTADLIVANDGSSDVFNVSEAGDVTIGNDIIPNGGISECGLVGSKFSKVWTSQVKLGPNSATYAEVTYRSTGSGSEHGIKVYNESGILGTVEAARLTTNVTLSAATGNEIANTIAYTVNKATSGDDTGLLISKTDTASPGTSLALDIQTDASSVFSVDDVGTVDATDGNFVGQLNVNNSLTAYEYAAEIRSHTSGGWAGWRCLGQSISGFCGALEYWSSTQLGSTEDAMIFGSFSAHNVVFSTNNTRRGGFHKTTGVFDAEYGISAVADAIGTIPITATGSVGQTASLGVFNNGSNDVLLVSPTGLMTVGDGTDADINLLQVNVTGSPLLHWDESTDRFQFTKGLHVGGDLYFERSDGKDWYGFKAVSGRITVRANNTDATVLGNDRIITTTGARIGWSSTAQASGSIVTAFTEISSGIVALGNGTASDKTGELRFATGEIQAIHQATEVTSLPTGTTQTITLADNNHQTLDLTSSTGDTTVTLTVPSGSSAGTLIIEQHATTARDITWAVSAGTFKWMGTEPTWSSDAVSAIRIVTWRYDGAVMYLAATDVAA